MELETGDLVLCIVDRIEKTNVFVKIRLGNKEIDGSIVTSEIAPGRIRNLRSYVVPKKKIVCKVLRTYPNGNVELSLRRVTVKEKKELMEEQSQEKSYNNIIRSVVGKEKADEIISEITKNERLYDFINEVKDNPKNLDKFFDKKDSEKILQILLAQKPKKASIKKEMKLFTYESSGIETIKEILGKINGVEISYLSAGKYSMKSESEDIKSADKKLKEVAEKIRDFSKKHKIIFEIREK